MNEDATHEERDETSGIDLSLWKRLFLVRAARDIRIQLNPLTVVAEFAAD